MDNRRRWWPAFFLAAILMTTMSWLICAVPAWSGRLSSLSARIAFFIPLAGLCLPFLIGWITAKRTCTHAQSASASGVFVGVLMFCLVLGVQDALLYDTPAALVIMMGVGGMLGLVASLSALVGHVAAMDHLAQNARRVPLPRARVARNRNICRRLQSRQRAGGSAAEPAGSPRAEEHTGHAGSATMPPCDMAGSRQS